MSAAHGQGSLLATRREESEVSTDNAAPERQDDDQARAAREAELAEVLSSYADPRIVSYRFVVGFVVVGLLGSALVASTFAGRPLRQPLRFEAPAPEAYAHGVAAYQRGDWHEAELAMHDAARRAAGPAPRVADYLERLDLVHQDGDRLSKAEEALEADEPERALVLVAQVASSSPLFAQAEGLGRKARARMELDMRTDPVLHEEAEPVLIDPRPEPAVNDGKRRPRARPRPVIVKPPEPSYEGAW